MSPSEYIKASVKLDRPDLDYSPIANRLSATKDLLRIIHATMGMSGETGEILDTVKKSMMYGKELNTNNLKEECGDVLWYMAILLDTLGSSFEEVMQMNHEKLKKRYPEGFSEKAAIERKDKA